MFQIGGGHGKVVSNALADADSLLGEGQPEHARATLAMAWRVASIWLVLWLVPVIALVATLGADANSCSERTRPH